MSARTPRLVVSVGTDHHPFDRLVGWIDEFAQDFGIDCFVQHGTSSAPSVDGAPLIPHGELLAMFAAADVVVTHGGPATIMDARQCGKLPITMARDPRHGEHVDDHQQLFAARMGAAGVVTEVRDREQLRAAIAAGLEDPSSLTVDPAEDESALAVRRVATMIEALEATPVRRLSRRRGRPVPPDAQLIELPPG